MNRFSLGRHDRLAGHKGEPKAGLSVEGGHPGRWNLNPRQATALHVLEMREWQAAQGRLNGYIWRQFPSRAELEPRNEGDCSWLQ